ncbi:MAG TPA: acetyl-CoA carboxylase biotin carboxyl carrier protein subunit [Candidatus Limnocylindrales bacterium]|nr:acetyl-CoA carboxylase biotin carboxyl carrier protein subunit [Candidatus Limnocylindrales bacterium]
MSGFRVIDRSTGEPVVGPDRQVAATPRPTPPSERPVVLPGAAASTVRGRTAVEVVVAGWQFEFEVEDADLAELRDRATGGRDAATHHGPTEVRAIIPGRVVSIVVVVGDEVTAGQRLLAVEAMKMENELRAPRDGTVERVTVSVGQTVELGDALVVIR